MFCRNLLFIILLQLHKIISHKHPSFILKNKAYQYPTDYTVNGKQEEQKQKQIQYPKSYKKDASLIIGNVQKKGDGKILAQILSEDMSFEDTQLCRKCASTKLNLEKGKDLATAQVDEEDYWPKKLDEVLSYTYISEDGRAFDYHTMRSWDEIKDVAWCRAKHEIEGILNKTTSLYYLNTQQKTDDINEYGHFIFGILPSTQFDIQKDSKAIFFSVCVPVALDHKVFVDTLCPFDKCSVRQDKWFQPDIPCQNSWNSTDEIENLDIQEKQIDAKKYKRDRVPEFIDGRLPEQRQPQPSTFRKNLKINRFQKLKIMYQNQQKQQNRKQPKRMTMEAVHKLLFNFRFQQIQDHEWQDKKIAFQSMQQFIYLKGLLSKLSKYSKVL